VILKAIFWASAAGLAWTHAGYPVAAAALRRVRERPVRKEEIEPTVSLIVPAHDEEDVIGRRVENLLELDYPADKLEVVIASDGSTDRTHEIVGGYDGVRLFEAERGGKLPTMNRAVRETDSEILAFGDANATWAPDALRKLVRNFADPDVAYVCGQVRFQREDGTNKEGLYWRYEMWLRESESALGSITGGNGAIYAVRRSDYVEWPFGHGLRARGART
jgi:cellulose synthase/poly-beta-1,6-N-acetylglucosamine synthase-like glycosyltransferase